MKTKPSLWVVLSLGFVCITPSAWAIEGQCVVNCEADPLAPENPSTQTPNSTNVAAWGDPPTQAERDRQRRIRAIHEQKIREAEKARDDAERVRLAEENVYPEPVYVTEAFQEKARKKYDEEIKSNL